MKYISDIRKSVAITESDKSDEDESTPVTRLKGRADYSISPTTGRKVKSRFRVGDKVATLKGVSDGKDDDEQDVKESLDEMDKSAPQPGRDGKVSHSTYGSRDKKDSDYFKGKEFPVKPITVKQMKKDSLDILKKQGVAESIDEMAAEINPPTVLILKRKFIREMPTHGGQRPMRVAVYYNETLKRYFSIPYQPRAYLPSPDNQLVAAESTVESDENISEAVMDSLHKIVKDKQANRVKFANGKTMSVDHFTASAITQVHNALNDENKKKFADMVHKSPEHLHKAAAFAFKHAK